MLLATLFDRVLGNVMLVDREIKKGKTRKQFKTIRVH